MEFFDVFGVNFARYVIEGGFMRATERKEYRFDVNDLGLVVFVLVAGWLLVFQSGIFR